MNKVTDTYFLIENFLVRKRFTLSIVDFGEKSVIESKCLELNSKSDTDYIYYEVKQGVKASID